MSEWNTQELGSLLKDKGYIRGPFGSALKRGEMVEAGIPVYEQKNAIYDEREFRFFITPEKFEELKRFQVKTNDLVISCSGTVGKISIIKEEDPKGIISQALLILRPDIEKITLKFLFYFLTSNHGFNLITQVSHGSVQINIAARKIVETIPVTTPSLPEQKAIAAVLSSLDDKIDLLHRQTKTLEQMAETLFRQWFVVDADEGWEEGVLGDVIELHYGKGLKKKDRTGSGFSVVGSSRIVDYHSEFLVEGPGIVIGRKGTLGKVIYLWDNFYPIDTTYYVKSKVDSIGLLYEYFLLKTINFEEMNTDSAVPGLNRDIALSTDIRIAPENLLHDFNELASAFIKKMKKNKSQIRTLEKMRDTLLPKLMSGEIVLNHDLKGL